MKKTIFKVAIVAVFALIAGYNVYTSQKSVYLSALALDNIEALASEWSYGFDCRWSGNYFICTPWGSGSGCPCYM